MPFRCIERELSDTSIDNCMGDPSPSTFGNGVTHKYQHSGPWFWFEDIGHTFESCFLFPLLWKYYPSFDCAPANYWRQILYHKVHLPTVAAFSPCILPGFQPSFPSAGRWSVIDSQSWAREARWCPDHSRREFCQNGGKRLMWDKSIINTTEFVNSKGSSFAAFDLPMREPNVREYVTLYSLSQDIKVLSKASSSSGKYNGCSERFQR